MQTRTQVIWKQLLSNKEACDKAIDEIHEIKEIIRGGERPALVQSKLDGLIFKLAKAKWAQPDFSKCEE